LIKVTKLDNSEYYINPHQIESIETKPDTTILLLSGKHIIVRESTEEILARIIEYRKRIGGFGNED